MINSDMVRKIDMPANLFSNLGGDYKPTFQSEDKEESIVKRNNSLAEDMKEYYESGDIKMNKLSSGKQYRERLNKMYENFEGLKPIDSEIKDTILTSNYIEKGIVIKPTIQEMKQFWTEYRLMNNERKSTEERIYQNPTSIYSGDTPSTDEFNALFEKLTKKVQEINQYIDELKEMKESIEKKDRELKKNREELELNRQEFLNYKQEEEEKIRKEKENLKINFNKLQSIIDNLDSKLNEVE